MSDKLQGHNPQTGGGSPSCLTAKFFGSGNLPTHPPDPAYPNGKHVDASGGAIANCSIELPHPTPCIGSWLLVCSLCGLKAVITAAGRVDDPSRVTVPCKIAARPQ